MNSDEVKKIATQAAGIMVQIAEVAAGDGPAIVGLVESGYDALHSILSAAGVSPEEQNAIRARNDARRAALLAGINPLPVEPDPA
jgi:hypothetical protein